MNSKHTDQKDRGRYMIHAESNRNNRFTFAYVSVDHIFITVALGYWGY